MVCDLSALQEIINDLVVEHFDHTFLNKDIEFFHHCVPTADNIALYFSDILKKPIHNLGATLHKIDSKRVQIMLQKFMLIKS